MSEIGKALAGIRTSIKTICKTLKLTYEPTLVAVSKTKPVTTLQTAYDHGQRHFGENYVQEFITKAPELPKDIKWHFIGHIQTNKAKKVVQIPNLYMVETVDSEKLASVLNKARETFKKTEKLKVLVQIKTSDEPSKCGVEPSECTSLCKYVIDSCPHLEFAGLMTIGLYAPGPEGDKCFQSLVSCKTKLLSDLKEEKDELPACIQNDDFVLSMGMSSDYESAIKHGSTNVRVGSTIFGARDKPKAKTPKSSATDADNQTAEEKSETKEN